MDKTKDYEIGFTNKSFDFQKAEPLLYDELVRRQQSLLPKLEKKKVDSWEALEKQDPGAAAGLWDHLQRSGILRNFEILRYIEAPYRGMSPKEYALDFYHKTLFRVYDSLTEAIGGDIETIFRLSEYYLSPGDDEPEDPYLSFRLLRITAEQGYKPAYPLLGKYYVYGIGTSKNPGEAVRWFLKTDFSQDVDILDFMASCYHSGIGVTKDETKACDYWVEAALRGHPNGFRLLETAAHAGHARGQYHFGLGYQQGIGVPADIKQALHWFHKAAEQGHAPAQCRLGILYSDGEFDIENDPETAIQWFRLAADQNDVFARSRLADCLFFGEGTEQNVEEAARILRELAGESSEFPKGEPTSQFRLGTLLTNPEYAGYNPKEGIKLLRKSAEQDDPAAQTALGLHYYEGFEDIVKQNKKEARSWFHKAAKQGSPEAQYRLGEIYFNGEGVPANRKDAFKWYKISTDNGYAAAAQKLAHFYLNGIGTRKDEEEGYWLLALLTLWGDEEAGTLLRSAVATGNPAAEYGMWGYYYNQNDLEAGRDWLEKAAEKGSAKALCSLAMLYEDEGNDEEKLRCFRLAAEKGDAEAQTRLGLALEQFGPEKNDAPENREAFKWMKAAADQGHVDANYFLGNFYRDGTGIDSDPQKAFECYSQAAEQGSSDGLERVGGFYLNGIVVPENHEAAFQCFQRSAELGNPKGQCQLGLSYLYGNGCPQDTELAFQWISRAAESGHPAVIQQLQNAGLDIAKLSGGFQEFRKSQSQMNSDHFGSVFDRILNDSPKTILSIPPGQREENS